MGESFKNATDENGLRRKWQKVKQPCIKESEVIISNVPTEKISGLESVFGESCPTFREGVAPRLQKCSEKKIRQYFPSCFTGPTGWGH